jgi:hypothetical protein
MCLRVYSTRGTLMEFVLIIQMTSRGDIAAVSTETKNEKCMKKARV